MRTLQKVVPTSARLFLGLVFTVFGLNFFLHFLPTPPEPPKAMAFAGALFGSGYFFPLLKTIEVAAGVLLLTGLFVPLALAVLAPVIVNIVGFHLFLAPSGLPIPLAVLAAELYLAWTYRAVFAPMLHLRTPLPQRASDAGEPSPVHLAA
ncbi:MAG TPA: DoxX family protein [Polyangia bacterium]|nr:DoxX family protein [Polyangia bacterium]